jgi:hypothetical protein
MFDCFIEQQGLSVLKKELRRARKDGTDKGT